MCIEFDIELLSVNIQKLVNDIKPVQINYY